MEQNKQASTSVNNVTLSSEVVGGNAKKLTEDQTKNEVKALTEQLGEMSKKVESMACCQAPFDEALSHYLATEYKKNHQRKRP
ncbi:hypothetical protein HQQ94_09575 [Shewanella sp. VB17]|uniref:hypothetical protein n=1 Tax=Shewanella sp. VB17 TaxID=2739432 RepID=UPI001564888E|nr:hypothetical protein [Shewanella sp. VB17]NRD73490.1 hypothetical protein [Shewanella sp. VB17]